MGQTFTGRNHDYAMLKAEFPPEMGWVEDLQVVIDLGYQGIIKAIPLTFLTKSLANPKTTLSPA